MPSIQIFKTSNYHMISKTHNDSLTGSLVTCHRNNGGFAALISVVLLATGVLAFSLATLASAVSYGDMVSRREIRIQAGLNLEVCLDTTELMIGRDYFLVGTSTLSEFGCIAFIISDMIGNYSIDASARLSGVTVNGSRQIQI